MEPVIGIEPTTWCLLTGRLTFRRYSSFLIKSRLSCGETAKDTRPYCNRTDNTANTYFAIVSGVND